MDEERIRGYTAAQVRAAEAPHLAAGEPLMQRAADALAAVIAEVLESRGIGSARVLLLVGSGNNGGDALFAGARLQSAGHEVTIVPVGSRLHEAGLAAALAAGARRVELPGDEAELRVRAGELAGAADVLVDGILGTGTGADPALRGAAREVVAAIRSLDPRDAPIVVAVDIPSGIDPDRGAVPDGNVLVADTTVTFGGYKAGLLRSPASAYAGRIRLVDIGLGPDLAALTPAVEIAADALSSGFCGRSSASSRCHR